MYDSRVFLFILVSLCKHQTMWIGLLGFVYLHLRFQWHKKKYSFEAHHRNIKKWWIARNTQHLFVFRTFPFPFESKLRAILFIHTWSIRALIQNYARKTENESQSLWMMDTMSSFFFFVSSISCLFLLLSPFHQKFFFQNFNCFLRFLTQSIFPRALSFSTK